MRGSRGGGEGSGPPPPPWNLQNLISPILLEMKKSVIFQICALPQLYVKVGPPPPLWKNCLNPRLGTCKAKNVNTSNQQYLQRGGAYNH